MIYSIIFFIVYNLKPGQRLSVSKFDNLWEEVLVDGSENLLTEILTRGELKVTDLIRAFLAMPISAPEFFSITVSWR